MVAVQGDDVDRGLPQGAADGPQLPRHLLLEAAHQHLAHRHHLQPPLFGGPGRSGTILHQKVGMACAPQGEHAAPFQTDTGPPHQAPEQPQCARVIGQHHVNIVHPCFSLVTRVRRVMPWPGQRFDGGRSVHPFCP
ncbi:hypothetical protein D3C75_955680 [compost metagenome]